MNKLKLLFAACALFLGNIATWAQTDVTSTYITNADFSSTEGWTQEHSSQYWSLGNGLIGTYAVANSKTSTTDATHLATEYCLGIQCRWSTNYANFTQTKENASLPAGAYTVTFDVQNTNTNTTSATYENKFFVKVGETTYNDSKTEWMSGSSAWTTHTISFTLEEETTADLMFSFGYGTGSNNFGSGNTPHLYVSHLAMTLSEFIDPTAISLDDVTMIPTATKNLSVAYTPADANHNTSITWKSLDESVATVSAEGVVTAVAVGTTTITATTANDVSTTCTVTVKEAPIVSGTTDLYLYNEKEDQFLSSGKNYGTQAIIDNYGQELTATLVNGGYSLKTQQYNNCYLGSNLYMDNGTAANWLFVETASGSGKYYLTLDGINYVTSNGAGEALITVTTPTDASVWSIVPKADRKAALASATIDNPSNATFLIGDANFSRNCLQTPWTMEASNKNLSGGAQTNMCAESYRSTFTLSQTLSSMPVGVYGLVAQGFYRQDGEDNENLPYFYIADQKGTFPEKTGSENSMSDASASFAAGSYTIDPVYYRLDEEGNITLGAKLETNAMLWCIWDNFQLSYYGDVTVAAVKMKASVDAYNAAIAEAETFTEESMFADAWTTFQGVVAANTLDLNDPELTEEALTTATANLVKANAAATIAVAAKANYDTAVALTDGKTNVNLTSMIVNPSFENGLTGWTNVGGMVTQGNTSFGKTGSTYAEFWQPNGTKGLSQTIGLLPAGVYTLTLDAKARGVTSAKLFANTNEVAMTIADEQHTYNLTFELADKASINLGFEGVGTGAGNSWLALDNFTLTYVGTLDDLTYTKATGKMGTDKAEAQDNAEAAFLANKNLTTYNALLTAIADAEASKATYDKLKAAIDKAQDVLEANNFVTADATTAFENEITTATAAWTNVTYTDAQATSEIAVLGTAVSGWRAIASEGKAGAFMTSAWGKTADKWWDAPYINTWSVEGDNDGSGFSVPFFEYFANNDQNLPAKTFTATLTGLDYGVYEVEIWARVQRRSDADFNSDNSKITMSVNGGEAVSIMSNTENNVGKDTNVMRLGRYTAIGNVTDGTLTLSINVTDGSNVHWLSWRDVKYRKIKDLEVEISSALYASYVTKYDVDFTQTENLTAYKVTSANYKLVHLEEIDEAPKGEAVILKGETEGTYELKAASNAVAAIEDNLYKPSDGTVVGNGSIYALGNINGAGFYLVGEGVNVPADKGYLTIELSAEAAKAFIPFNTHSTGIESLDMTRENVLNGQTFDLSGRAVKNPAKGLYIVNGKKVLVK